MYKEKAEYLAKVVCEKELEIDNEQRYNEANNENKELNKTIEKMKKDKLKSEKGFESKINDLKEQLKKSYTEVRKYCDENTKLLEEKKILLGIHQVNAELHDELKKNKNQNEVGDIEFRMILNLKEPIKILRILNLNCQILYLMRTHKK